MTIAPNELLQRLSETMRQEIGPAIDDEFTRTQAFMVSAILERVARQVALAPANDRAERSDMLTLLPRLTPLLDAAPSRVTDALNQAMAAGTLGSLGELIEALYDWGPDEPVVGEALSLIRPVLRRDIDRRMEIAR